jgi:hypothetical protein
MKEKRALFESVLDVLLSQEPLSAEDAVDELDFALDEEDDDTFVDVKASNRSNMHARHTHHHLGLTMACLSSSVKERCLRALRDSNTLMYPKAVSLLCSFRRASPVTSDDELISLASDTRTIPRLIRILLAACVKYERTAVCQALAGHFWSTHHYDRCAFLLPSCSASFLRKFLLEHAEVMAQKDFNFDKVLKRHPDVTMDFLEDNLKETFPLYRKAVWSESPFECHQSSNWLDTLLHHHPIAHLRLASLIRSYPCFDFTSDSSFVERGYSKDFLELVSLGANAETGSRCGGVIVPVFPLFDSLRSCIVKRCKFKGRSQEFWNVWFPLLLDVVAARTHPILYYPDFLSANDVEQTRDVDRSLLIQHLSHEDQENDLLVDCVMRSHTSLQLRSFFEDGDRLQRFSEMLISAKQLCNHHSIPRSNYQDHRQIFRLPLGQERYCLVFEKMLSAAALTEETSCRSGMHFISRLDLKNAFSEVVAWGGVGLHGSSRALAAFVSLHRSVDIEYCSFCFV